MARPRGYDEQAVLTAAMHAFRREGYAHISVTELEAATGLRTSSRYNAFGDKSGLSVGPSTTTSPRSSSPG